jgi:hypothetical protein
VCFPEGRETPGPPQAENAILLIGYGVTLDCLGASVDIRKKQMNKDNIIYSYTRTQAIEDGVLVDVSKLAIEAGFKVPVALTSAVHGKYVQVPPAADWQDETGRLWDILQMLRYSIRQYATQQEGLLFSLRVDNGNGARKVTLKSVRGYDDAGNPCLTIMMPEED